MSLSRLLRAAAISIATVIATVAVTTALARTGPTSSIAGRTVTAVRVVRDAIDNAYSETTTTTWTDFPGAATTITVPSNQQALILVRFSGESSCAATSSEGTGYCSVRVLVNGVEAEPSDGDLFAFGVVSEGTFKEYESHSVDRSLGPLAPGTYTVKLQWKTTVYTGIVAMTLDDWSFTVERVRV